MSIDLRQFMHTRMLSPLEAGVAEVPAGVLQAEQ